MKHDILVYYSLPSDLKKQLETVFNVHYTKDLLGDLAQLKTVLPKIVGAIGFGVVMTDNLLAQMPKLKAIATISAGFDHFNLTQLNQRQIRLMNTPDAVTNSTADMIFSLVLATARQVAQMDQFVRNKQWVKSIGVAQMGVDVYQKNIGIIGMGRIGRAVAKRAHLGFDMNVLYYSSHQHSDVETLYQADYCSLDTLLSASDFVCVTLPLNTQTEKLINAERLAKMKSSAILINGGRGKVVDQEALITALKTKAIRAAGLDVYEEEPLPLDSALLTLDNVTLLPHIGGATKQTLYNMSKSAVENLIEAVCSTPKINWVNPEVG
ncbi:NAD(P)-dependent oxidoreductase [Neisseria sp. Ec49-e6-T10]|uniref:NAD(P)-dependent oxidoreductase n=1 Tax=Neisseria sp. Ec49-e6-T10 TaxID=3140744 RepID=UPI003EB83836